MATDEFNRDAAASFIRTTRYAADQLSLKKHELLFFFSEYARSIDSEVWLGSYLDNHHPVLMKEMRQLATWSGLHDRVKKASAETLHKPIQDAERRFSDLNKILEKIMHDKEAQAEVAAGAKKWKARNESLLLLADEALFRSPPQDTNRWRFQAYPAVNPWLLTRFFAHQLGYAAEKLAPLVPPEYKNFSNKKQLADLLQEATFFVKDLEEADKGNKGTQHFYGLSPDDIATFGVPINQIAHFQKLAVRICQALERGRAENRYIWLMDNLVGVADPLCPHNLRQFKQMYDPQSLGLAPSGKILRFPAAQKISPF